MYNLSERYMDSLIKEVQSISERVAFGGILSAQEARKLGESLLPIQTEMRTGLPYVPDNVINPYIQSRFEHVSDALSQMVDMGDSITCSNCGAIMVRSGVCYKCMTCGNTSGCS